MVHGSRSGCGPKSGRPRGKYVAKVASDLDKPDGLTVAPPGQEAAFLGPLPLARLWGAGRVLQRRLAALGMTTIGDLQALTLERLVAELGESTGVHFYDLCRGLDSRPVMSASSPKSVSRETTFSDDVVDDQVLNTVLLEHAEDVGRRLRYRGLAGRTLRIKLRYPPFETHSRQTRLTDPTCDDACIFRHAVSLLRAARQSGRPVRLLGVGVSDLCAADVPVQRELFPSPPDDSAGTVNRTLDAIRERFGGDAAGRLGGVRRRTAESEEP